MDQSFRKDAQFYKFCAYGFLKNLRFFEAFFILFLRSRGVSFLQIAVLYAVREGAVNLLEIPTGLFADGWGRKKTMLASFCAYIAAFLVFAFSGSYPLLLGAMVLYAFGDACRTGTHKAMIFAYLSRRGWSAGKSRYYGYTRAWSQRGSALSALLAGALVFWKGDYQAIFLYSVVPYLLNFLLIASYPAYLDASSGKASEGASILKESFAVLRKRGALLKLGNVSIFAGYYKAVKDYLQPILQGAAVALPLLKGYGQEQRGAVTIGLFYFFIYLGTSWAAGRAGGAQERWGDRGRFLFSTLLIGAGAGLAGGFFLFRGLPWLSGGLFLLIFMLENLRKPVGIAYLGDSIDPEVLATVLSAESQGETLWTALFALLIGAGADLFSLPAGLLIAAGTLALLSLFFAGDRERAPA